LDALQSKYEHSGGGGGGDDDDDYYYYYADSGLQVSRMSGVMLLQSPVVFFRGRCP
jgi:hypothetical protein